MSNLGRLSKKCAWPIGAVLLSCSLSPSEVPLQSSDPRAGDVYFYGPHHGGKTSLPPSPAAKEPAPKPSARPETKSEPSEPAPTPKVEVVVASEEDAGAPQAAPSVAGRYLGTDTVVIQFIGLPEEPQVDDQAKVDVEQRGERQLAVTVVDSSQGTPLCTVLATLTSPTDLDFEAGQPCFTGMLGIPIDAELVSGSGKLEGSRLSFELTVNLALRGPGGAIEGQIDYEFDGARAK